MLCFRSPAVKHYDTCACLQMWWGPAPKISCQIGWDELIMLIKEYFCKNLWETGKIKKLVSVFNLLS